MTHLAASIPSPAGLNRPSADLSAFIDRKGRQQQIILSVKGAHCGGCLKKIEQAIGAMPGIVAVRFNLSDGRLKITWESDIGPDCFVQAVEALGFQVSPYSASGGQAQQTAQERRLLAAMGVAGFGMANIMLLSVPVWAGQGEMGDTTRQLLHALSGLIALPVLVYSGGPFLGSAWWVLRRGQANMDVPISLALLLAFCVSVWETAISGPHAYFDACVMLLFFLLIGRFLDARLRRQAHAAANDLAALRKSAVQRLDAQGRVSLCRASEIRTGDRILLPTGARAVIDMRVIRGGSEIDEHLVSGESLPRRISPDDTLYAGTVNLDDPIEGEALGPASDSLLSDIADMLEAGHQNRARYQRLADRAVAFYIPFVHSTAALTGLTWLLMGATINKAIMIAVTTLIITCPCALALAGPVAQVVTAGRLFRAGIYLISGDALERLAEIDYLVFDKTGTLTRGRPVLLSQSSPCPEQAAQLARASHHPLSRALAEAAGPGPLASQIREYPGCGLEGRIEGELCRLGSADWLNVTNTQKDQHLDEQPMALWFVRGDAAPVRFAFEDQLLDDAQDSLRTLADMGLAYEILSGDRAGPVSEVADLLSVERWTAGCLPSDKVIRLEALAAQGHKTLMIGDGLNDAGALALAHASMAPGGALDVSQSAAEAVYTGGLKAVPLVVSLARRTRRIMQMNFTLAAAYNLIAVPIAVSGHVTPLIAAIAMSASSLLVTLNALRLNFGAP